MKKFILSFALVMVIALGYATNVVPVEQAMKASKNFLSERVGAQDAKGITLTHVYTEYAEDGTPVFYRFQVGDNGFMIVSATNLAAPVLAYSLEGNFKSIPATDYYCNNYKKQISYLIENPQAATDGAKAWSKYLSDDFSVSASKGAKKNPCVEPLVTTKWTQETYYNAYCPVSSAPKASMDYRCPVGCVALTMSNLMYYYRFPSVGVGGVSYIPREYDDETGELLYTYPVQSVVFSQKEYNYDAMSNMLDSYTGELAELIYNAGVSVRMGYGAEGSGSQSEYAIEALQDHFKFSPKAQFQNITDIVTTADQAPLWIAAATTELDARRPIFFSGQSEEAGGHAWIVDGYTTIYDTTITTETIVLGYDTTTTSYDTTITTFDTLITDVDTTITSTDTTITIVETVITSIDSIAYNSSVSSQTYFHVNWGWAGSDNGYYLLTNQLSSGYGNFNVEGSESMMLKMAPEDSLLIKPTTGDIRITAAKGTISDGAGNQKYQPNTNRSWVIACPNASSYKLQFSKLKTKAGDEITIYNGGTTSSNVLQRFSGDYLMDACSNYANLSSGGIHADFEGQTLPGAVTVNQDSVLIVFTTNADEETDYGFVLDYEATVAHDNVCSELNPIMTDVWHAVLTDKANNEISDNPYPANTVCQWQLRVPQTAGYAMNLRKFDLKEGDYIEFFDIANASSPTFLARYDINNLPTEPFTLNYPKVSIKFVADNWQEGNGFELEFYKIEGVDDHSGIENVSIYPNPATNLINVAIEATDAQDIAASIVDMTGKTIYVEQFSFNGGEQIYTIPVNNMAKGIYFLNLQSKQGKTVRKFIVE